MRLPKTPQRQAQHFLRRCFAYRSGDGADPCFCALASRAPEFFHRDQHVAHNVKRTNSTELIDMRLIDDRSSGAHRHRFDDEIVTVAVVALDGEEQIALLQRARINRNAVHALRYAPDDPRL